LREIGERFHTSRESIRQLQSKISKNLTKTCGPAWRVVKAHYGPRALPARIRIGYRAPGRSPLKALCCSVTCFAFVSWLISGA